MKQNQKNQGLHCCCKKFGYLEIYIFLRIMLASVDCGCKRSVSVSEETPGVAGVKTNEARRLLRMLDPYS